MSSFAALLLLAAAADPFGSAAALELTYSGRLQPVRVSDPQAADKGFTVSWFIAKQESEPRLFVVAEDAATLPWAARFGFAPPEAAASGPRIGYRFGDADHVVELPGAILRQVDSLDVGASFSEGPLTFVSVGDKTVNGRTCRVVEGSSAFGRDRTVAVEKANGLVIRHEQDVTLGRGDRFRLTLELADAVPLDADAAAKRQVTVDQLRRVAEAAGQGDRDPSADLPADVRVKVAAAFAPLVESKPGPPYDALVAAITRDIDEQGVREKGVAGLAEKVVGSPAPALDLKDLDGKPIDSGSHKGKVVVLHFWEYDNESLAAPYGQVGYLDFLHRKRAKAGVAVFGVAVNPAFADPEVRGRPARSAKTLAEFMNLGYPIAADDGTLLRAFGDPRPLASPLPLWVVIDSSGVVRSYKSGVHDLEPNEGLKELDAMIVELLREGSTKRP